MSETVKCARCGDYKCSDPECSGKDCPKCGGFVCPDCGVFLTYTVKANPDLSEARLRFEKPLNGVTEIEVSSVPDAEGTPRLVVTVTAGGIGIITTIRPSDNTEDGV